jgi:hypothetical protein
LLNKVKKGEKHKLQQAPIHEILWHISNSVGILRFGKNIVARSNQIAESDLPAFYVRSNEPAVLDNYSSFEPSWLQMSLIAPCHTEVLNALRTLFIHLYRWFGALLCKLIPFSDLIGPRGCKFVSFHHA